VSTAWLTRDRPARGDAQRHANRDRPGHIQLDSVAGPEVSAVFLQLGDHAHRECGRRADLLGLAADVLPVPVPGQDQATAQGYQYLRADLRQSRLPGIGEQADQHVAAARVKLVWPQVAGEEPGSWLTVQRGDKQPFTVLRRDLPGQRQDVDVLVGVWVTGGWAASCRQVLPGRSRDRENWQSRSLSSKVADGTVCVPAGRGQHQVVAWRWHAASTISAPLRARCQVRQLAAP
jgi:hypothetical protein